MKPELLKHPRQLAGEKLRRRALNRALSERDRINARYSADFRNCPELRGIADNEFPKVIEITPDAQRRFGEEFGISMIDAYQEGTDNLVQIIDISSDLPIETVIAWAFSSDNWNRPPEQVDGLLKLMLKNYPKLEKKILEKNARFALLGRREIREDKAELFEAYAPFHAKLLELEEKTRDNMGKNVVLGFDFGGADERMRLGDKLYRQGHQDARAGIELVENEPEEVKYARVLKAQDGEGKFVPVHLGIRTGEKIDPKHGFILTHISDVGIINGPPTFWAYFKKQFPLFTAQDLARAILEYVDTEVREGK